MLNTNPSDFFLFRIGSYNFSKGILIPAVLESLGCGSDFIKAPVSLESK